jgi:hypothetical protein
MKVKYLEEPWYNKEQRRYLFYECLKLAKKGHIYQASKLYNSIYPS